jgi:hypothetical protein
VAKKSRGGGEFEHHVVGVRLRVVGSGELDLSLADLDNIQVQNLVPITMAATTRIEPFRLSNLQSQRIRLVGKTTEINETFRIQTIILFGKPVAQEYPA